MSSQRQISVRVAHLSMPHLIRGTPRCATLSQILHNSLILQLFMSEENSVFLIRNSLFQD